jgi:hypothetical protein
MLTIYSDNNFFTLTQADAIRLQKVFNLSDKGREWLEIGDVLHEYTTGAYNGNLTLEPRKFNFIYNLLCEYIYLSISK